MKPKLWIALAVALVLMPSASAFANGEGAVGGARVLAPHYYGGNGTFAYTTSVPYYGYSGYDGARSIYMYNGPYSNHAVPSVNIEVQTYLTQLGYYQGPIDGNVAPGSRTAVAVASYQRDHHMPITGLINGGLLTSLSGQ
jgi:hypothetical protein